MKGNLSVSSLYQAFYCLKYFIKKHPLCTAMWELSTFRWFLASLSSVVCQNKLNVYIAHFREYSFVTAVWCPDILSSERVFCRALNRCVADSTYFWEVFFVIFFLTYLYVYNHLFISIQKPFVLSLRGILLEEIPLTLLHQLQEQIVLRPSPGDYSGFEALEMSKPTALAGKIKKNISFFISELHFVFVNWMNDIFLWSTK